jgi:hypothetical protein
MDTKKDTLMAPAMLSKKIAGKRIVVGAKQLRKALNSEKPIKIRTMIELYIVDRDYLSKEEAKKEYKNKPTNVKFVIPSTVPPLNEATRRLVERANAEIKK